ncbi:MAG: hypothetical protein ACKOUM_00435 [Sphingopyxis sp.]
MAKGGAIMFALRAFALRHARFAALLLVLAIAVRALVPAGYMVARGPLLLNLTYCVDGSSNQRVQVAIPMNADAGKKAGSGTGHDRPCAFTALSMAALGGADPVVLLGALLFLLALGFAPVPRPVVPFWPRIRPPLRGPPLLIS